MTISELNTRATVKSFVVTQDDDTGRPVQGEPSTWERWVKATNITGSRVLENMGIVHKEGWQFEKLFEESKPTLSTYHVIYKGKEMSIAGVERTRGVERTGEGFAWFEKITAYVTT